MFENIKLSILDLLTLILPGAFFLILISDTTPAYFVTTLLPFGTSEWISNAMLIAAAYTIGHFIYFIASYLDEWLYDNVKKVFWSNNMLLAYVINIKKKKTGIADRSVLNTFKWSCHWLMVNKPEMYGLVERYMAESKFFRSLVIIFLAACIVLPVKAGAPLWNQVVIFIILFLLTVLSLIRYLAQRYKSIATAYQCIIAASDEPMRFTTEVSLFLSELMADTIVVKEKKTKIASFFCKTGCVIRLCLKFPSRKSDATTDTANTEIRWFAEAKNQVIVSWFQERGIDFERAGRRNDYYLYLPESDRVSIKLRENKIEIKQMKGDKTPKKLSGRPMGFAEKWHKTAFDIAPGDMAAHSQNSEWVKIEKTRLAVKMRPDGSIVPDINDRIPAGCIVEYTRLRIRGEEWYTFALDWFGEKYVKHDTGTLGSLLEKLNLPASASCSYPAFINAVCRKK